MSVNKVQLANGETIIDISDSTVTPETLAEGVTAHDASGQKITGKMVPGGGASVQSDWNQTDETAADFIKHKPFGYFPTVILEEQELSFDEDAGSLIGMTSLSIIGDTELTVVIDGVSYETKSIDLAGNIFFGNLSIMGMGDDTGEPFVGMYQAGMIAIMIGDTASHTVKITGNSIVKLPQKYYERQAVFYLSAPYLYLDASRTTKATRNDVLEAVKTAPIMIDAGIALAPAIYVDFSSAEYARVWMNIGLTDGTIAHAAYHTAEYTP